MELTFHKSSPFHFSKPLIAETFYHTLNQNSHLYSKTFQNFIFFNQCNVPLKEIVGTSSIYKAVKSGTLLLGAAGGPQHFHLGPHLLSAAAPAAQGTPQNACSSAEQNLQTSVLKVIRANLTRDAYVSP